MAAYRTIIPLASPDEYAGPRGKLISVSYDKSVVVRPATFRVLEDGNLEVLKDTDEPSDRSQCTCDSCRKHRNEIETTATEEIR